MIVNLFKDKSMISQFPDFSNSKGRFVKESTDALVISSNI